MGKNRLSRAGIPPLAANEVAAVIVPLNDVVRVIQVGVGDSVPVLRRKGVVIAKVGAADRYGSRAGIVFGGHRGTGSRG